MHQSGSGQLEYQAFNKDKFKCKIDMHCIWLILCCLICLQEYPGSQTAGWGWAAVSWLSQLSVAGNADR